MVNPAFFFFFQHFYSAWGVFHVCYYGVFLLFQVFLENFFFPRGGARKLPGSLPGTQRSRTDNTSRFGDAWNDDHFFDLGHSRMAFFYSLSALTAFFVSSSLQASGHFF